VIYLKATGNYRCYYCYCKKVMNVELSTWKQRLWRNLR
jgi:hypothetical protein